MFRIGCHLSAAAGYEHMGKEALSIGANTFQFFTRNPRGGAMKALNQADIDAFLNLANEHHFAQILAHAPYTLNACAADDRVRRFAYQAMAEDLERMEYLPGNLYNFHPGSHVGQGIQTGIEKIAELLNHILKPEQTTTVLLETMAGKGSEVGGKFEELREILDRVELKDKMGVCLDTCHISDAGYDIIHDLDGVVDTFDKIIGLDRLKAIHLNDSKNPPESHKDRHEKVGQGYLGIETLEKVINHPKLKHLPFLLETPNELPGYAEEIKQLKSLYRQ